MPSLEVRNILQTNDGRVWIAHRNGVSSYDGIRFKNYYQQDGFNRPPQSYLCLDKNNNLYSLSDGRETGITMLNNNKWELIIEYDSLPLSSKVTGFEILNKNGINIFSFSTRQHGFFYYDSLMHHIQPHEIGCTDIYSIEHFNNTLLLATDKGIIEFSGNSFQTKYKELIKNRNAVYALSSKNDQLLVVSPAAIKIIKNDECIYTCSTKGKISWDVRNTTVRCVLDQNNNIYVGDEMQFYTIKPQNSQISEIDTKTGFTAEGVTWLYCDDENNTWAASNRGITIIYPTAFIHYSSSDILPDNEVSGIIEQSPGKYLLGHNMGISVFDGERILNYLRLTDDKNYNVNYRIQDFTSDGKGVVYFASSKGGFGMVKKNEIQWLDHPALKDITYFAGVYYDTITNRLWLSGSGLFGYLTEENKFFSIPTTSENLSVRKIYKFHDGNIYCGLNKAGFLKIDNNTQVENYYYKEGSVEDNNIYSMYLDRDNVLWIGTATGLIYFFKDQFHRKLEGYPEIEGPVYQVNSDLQDNIWLGTEISLLQFDGEKLIEYTESEGFRAGETNRAAFCLTDDSRIFIGGSSGLSIFNTLKNITIAPTQPRCEITGIHLDTTIYNPYLNHVFSSNQNSFLISFTPISFSGRKKIIQQFMLAGLDKNWKTIEDKHTSSAFYSSVNPGTYNFLYRVSNNGGRTWCRAKISGNILVEKPFYQKGWFIASVVFLVLIFLFLIFYLITRQQYSKSLKAEVEKRTLQLQNANNEKDKFFSIIAHDLRSPFNAIIGFSEILNTDYDSYTEEEKKLFISNIHEASENTYKLIEKLLDWSRAKTGRLKYEPSMIDLSLIGTSMTHTYRNAANKKDIVIKSLIGYHSKVYADKNLLETIFRNLISNAIKYTNPGGEIILTAKKEDEMTRISIRDTGTGMDHDTVKSLFYIDKKSSTPGTQDERGTGLGLLVVKEFVETNGGTIKVESELGKGSEFSFTVPSKMPAE